MIVVNFDTVYWQFNSFIRNLAESATLPIFVAGIAPDKDKFEENTRIIYLGESAETIEFAKYLCKKIKN